MDLYYPRNSPTAPPLIVTLRASIMSSLPLQQRFLIKGSRGSFIKYGLDPQESFLKRLAAGEKFGIEEGYGRESEDIWGELVLADEEKESTTWTKKRYVVHAGQVSSPDCLAWNPSRATTRLTMLTCTKRYPRRTLRCCLSRLVKRRTS